MPTQGTRGLRLDSAAIVIAGENVAPASILRCPLYEFCGTAADVTICLHAESIKLGLECCNAFAELLVGIIGCGCALKGKVG
jgi:hypothetical protein